jgi:hypothetical protein
MWSLLQVTVLEFKNSTANLHLKQLVNYKKRAFKFVSRSLKAIEQCSLVVKIFKVLDYDFNVKIRRPVTKSKCVEHLMVTNETMGSMEMKYVYVAILRNFK